jgi:addiction module RelE/StbE family toxin
MLPIVWSANADDDIAEIILFVGERNLLAAEKLWDLLHDSVLPLSDHPYLYRKSERVPGTREIVAHPNYVVIYQVTANAIDVLRVLHSRQQYP